VGRSGLNIIIELPYRLEFAVRDPYRGVLTKDKVNTTFDKRVSVELSALFRD